MLLTAAEAPQDSILSLCRWFHDKHLRLQHSGEASLKLNICLMGPVASSRSSNLKLNSQLHTDQAILTREMCLLVTCARRLFWPKCPWIVRWHPLVYTINMKEVQGAGKSALERVGVDFSQTQMFSNTVAHIYSLFQESFMSIQALKCSNSQSSIRKWTFHSSKPGHLK